MRCPSASRRAVASVHQRPQLAAARVHAQRLMPASPLARISSNGGHHRATRLRAPARPPPGTLRVRRQLQPDLRITVDAAGALASASSVPRRSEGLPAPGRRDRGETVVGAREPAPVVAPAKEPGRVVEPARPAARPWCCGRTRGPPRRPPPVGLKPAAEAQQPVGLLEVEAVTLVEGSHALSTPARQRDAAPLGRGLGSAPAPASGGARLDDSAGARAPRTRRTA